MSATIFPTMPPSSVAMPTHKPVDPILFGVFADIQRLTGIAEKLGTVYIKISRKG